MAGQPILWSTDFQHLNSTQTITHFSRLSVEVALSVSRVEVGAGVIVEKQVEPCSNKCLKKNKILDIE